MKVFDPMDITQEEFEEESKKILEGMAALLAKKNKDYGSASFQSGVIGNSVRLDDKFMRLKNMINKIVDDPNYKPNFESLGDTYDDIIGYATIGRIIFNHQLKHLSEEKK